MSKLVQLGSGKECKPRPWLNIDFDYPMDIPADCDYLEWDLKQGLPPQASGAEFIYACHFWEHLTYRDGYMLMMDCFRKLTSGGVLRILVPDFAKTAQAYIKRDYSFFKPISYASSNNRMMDYINYSLYQFNGRYNEHQCMYDAEHLIYTLSAAGFCSKEVSYDRSIDPNCDIREHFSLCVEGIKP